MLTIITYLPALVLVGVVPCNCYLNSN